MAHAIKIIDLDRPKLLNFRVDGCFEILIQNGKAIIMEGSLGGVTNETPPKYKHDCQNKCIYLGTFWPFKPKDTEPEVYDGYLHIGEITSIIARYGDDGPDYTSMPIDMINETSLEPLRHFKDDVNIERIKKAIGKAKDFNEKTN